LNATPAGARLRIVPADPAAVRAVHPVIERAYRGDSARHGWTHEADLISGERTSLDELEALAAAPNSRLLVAWLGDRAVGSAAVTDLGGGRCYVGLVAIEPELQAAGLGRQLLSAAEACARETFGASALEMTVISSRTELIAYYERRGYRRTGELRPFPVAEYPHLEMVVLERNLGSSA